MEKLTYKTLSTYTSPQLIDLLASLGIGSKTYKNDSRTAIIAEHGTFTSAELNGKKFVKIVVNSNDDKLFDYGARLWLKA